MELHDIIIEYYDENNNLLLTEDKTIHQLAWLFTITDLRLDPFSTNIPVQLKFLEELCNSAEYIIIKDKEKIMKEKGNDVMKEVILEWYDGSDGRLLKSEVTGAIEGSPMYAQIGCLCNPHLQDWVKEDDIPYGAHYLLVRETVAPGQKLLNLIKRHKEVNDKERKTMVQRLGKLGEEFGEVAEAICSYMEVPGCGYKKKTEDDVAEESLDVIIMALSILFNTSIDDDTAINLMLHKINKWESNMDRD